MGIPGRGVGLVVVGLVVVGLGDGLFDGLSEIDGENDVTENKLGLKLGAPFDGLRVGEIKGNVVTFEGVKESELAEPDGALEVAVGWVTTLGAKVDGSVGAADVIVLGVRVEGTLVEIADGRTDEAPVGRTLRVGGGDGTSTGAMLALGFMLEGCSEV